MAEEPLFGGRVPKRRRTGQRTASRNWAFDPAPSEPEDSVLSDEQEVALALAGLASAPGFAPREEASDEGAAPAPTFQPRRRGAAAGAPGRARGELARDQPPPYAGPLAGDAGILEPHGAGSFAPRAQPGLPGAALLARSDPPAGAREPALPAPELPPGGAGKPASGKRCASHVYIARFIEHQTNKTRLQQQAQQWPGNGFGAGAHAHEAELAERLPGGNGFVRLPSHTLPEPAAAQPHAQELPSVSGAHVFPGTHGFPGAPPGPGVQIPPAYAHLFNQQQPGAFPFVPPGQLGGAMGGQQQQAALAQALAGASRFFAPYSMQLLNGGIAQQLAAMAGLPIPSAAPSPSLPLPMPSKGHAELPKLPNGGGLKPEDLPKALQALPPGALAGVDLERLRAMLPPGFLDQRGGGAGDALAGLKPPPGRGEQLEWGANNGLPTRM